MAHVRLLINEAFRPSIPQLVTQRGRINLHPSLVRSGPVQAIHQCSALPYICPFKASLKVFGRRSHVSLLMCEIESACWSACVTLLGVEEVS